MGSTVFILNIIANTRTILWLLMKNTYSLMGIDAIKFQYCIVQLKRTFGLRKAMIFVKQLKRLSSYKKIGK